MRAFVLERSGQVTLTNNAPCSLLEEPYSAVLEPVVVVPCSSDINMVYGSDPKKPGNPILGRECVVWVKTVASRVQDFQVGDLIAVPAITPDWRDVGIQKGNDHHAERPFSGSAFGRSIPDVFAEALGVVDVGTTLAKLSEGVRLEDASVCIDMVMTSSISAEAAELKSGDVVVMLGVGVAGLMAVQGVALQEATEIYAVGTREIGARRILELGATEVLSYKDGNIREQTMARAGGQSTGAVFICGGNDDTFREVVDMVCYGIGRVVNLKHYPGDGDIGIPKFSDSRRMAGKTVHLELCRDGRARTERLLRFAEAGGIEPGCMVIHKFEGFPVLAEGFELMRRKPQDLAKMMMHLLSGGEEQQV